MVTKLATNSSSLNLTHFLSWLNKSTHTKCISSRYEISMTLFHYPTKHKEYIPFLLSIVHKGYYSLPMLLNVGRKIPIYIIPYGNNLQE
jgi:hypothetical protein